MYAKILNIYNLWVCIKFWDFNLTPRKSEIFHALSQANDQNGKYFKMLTFSYLREQGR